MRRRSDIIAELESMLRTVRAHDYDEFSLSDLKRLASQLVPQGLWGKSSETAQRLRMIELQLEILLDGQIRQHCPLSAGNQYGESSGGLTQMLIRTGRAAEESALDYIRTSLENSKNLRIVDPYFLVSTGPQKKVPNYASLAGKSIDRAIPASIITLTVYVNNKPRDPALVTEFKILCARRGIKSRVLEVDDIHDRVWIGDAARGVVVGASLNGLGKKWSIVLPLPPSDLTDVITELDSITTSKAVI